MRWLAISLLLSVGCDSAPAPDPVPAADTGPKPFDLAGYCSAMCKRTTECSLEAAQDAAELGGSQTEAALEAARQSSEAQRESCVAGCQSEPIDPLDRDLARSAQRCLHRKSCDELERCLAAL
jgi:hypothetical protein